MYAAVLSGCIPVVFDGGVDDFSLTEPTFWAWRGLSAHFPFDSFAVTYNASDVRYGRVDFVADLLRMPVEDPQRFLALRRGVDRAAEAMRYSDTQRDAFDELVQALQPIVMFSQQQRRA